MHDIVHVCMYVCVWEDGVLVPLSPQRRRVGHARIHFKKFNLKLANLATNKIRMHFASSLPVVWVVPVPAVCRCACVTPGGASGLCGLV